MTINKKYCPLPWIFQAIRNNGDIRVCCQANTSMSKGIYRKDNGEPYNATKDNLNEAKNSKLAKEIRLSMLNNETHEACIRCDNEDSAGIKSRRTYENENLNEVLPLKKAIEITKQDGSIDIMPIYYDLRFGNLCNLKCRMCGPTDSTQWYEDQVKIWGNTYNDSHGKVKLIKNKKGKYHPENNDYDWINSENFWRQIEHNIPNIQKIHTVGGEPLLIDQQYAILQECINQGHATNMSIEYNSNIVNIPERAWKIWKHFGEVKIGASVDGIGKVNNYIRHPSKWEVIEKNLKKLDSTEENIKVWIATTVQVYNILHLPEFMKWKLQQNFIKLNRHKGRLLLTTHLLHTPKHLNIRILPKETKKLILNRYAEFYIWLDQWISESGNEELRNQYFDDSRKILDSYSTYMMQEDWSDALPKFWEYTKKLDNLRNESFEQTFPELFDNIKRYVT